MTQNILKPFDDKDQQLLKEVDNACAAQVKSIREEAYRASLSGNDTLEVDMETLVWARIIKAYGILYNRAIEAGWITDIYKEKS